jgi:hypothetical protein
VVFNIPIGRELVSSYILFSKAHTKSSNFIIANTGPNSLFLTATNHNNSVASLTGISVLLGSPIYLYFHGTDYNYYKILVESIFESPAV